jgi:predicted phage-related endonuclease
MSDASFLRLDRRFAARQTIPRPSDTDAWLALRHDHWNASDAAVLADEHPFSTLADVAVRKIARTADAPNRAQLRGQHLEAAIAEWWADDHGLAVYEPTQLFICGDVMATLDRCIVGNNTDAVEIKTSAKHITEPEPYWWWQCQAQCLCAGLERVHLVVLDGSMDLVTHVVEADQHAMTFIGEEAAKVMAFIRRRELPPGAALTYRHHERLHPRHDDSVAELTDDLAADVAALARVRDERRALAAEEEMYMQRIAHALGDAGVGTWEDNVIVTWRSSTRVGIDLARVRRERPEIFGEFRTETTYRTLRTKERSS